MVITTTGYTDARWVKSIKIGDYASIFVLEGDKTIYVYKAEDINIPTLFTTYTMTSRIK